MFEWVFNFCRKYQTLTKIKCCCFRPPLCTLFRLNWVKQTPGTMRWNEWWHMPMRGFEPATQWSEVQHFISGLLRPWEGSNQRLSDQKSSTFSLDYYAHERVRTSDSVIRSPAPSLWTTTPVRGFEPATQWSEVQHFISGLLRLWEGSNQRLSDQKSITLSLDYYARHQALTDLQIVEGNNTTGVSTQHPIHESMYCKHSVTFHRWQSVYMQDNDQVGNQHSTTVNILLRGLMLCTSAAC